MEGVIDINLNSKTQINMKNNQHYNSNSLPESFQVIKKQL